MNPFYFFLRRGRNWVAYGSYSQREDGWWLFGFRAWAPKRRYLLVALWYWLWTGSSNYFYWPERRRRLGRSDRELFS